MNVRQIAIRAGIGLGVIEIAYGVFFRVGGFHFQSAWGWVFYLMLPVVIWWAQVIYRRESGSLTYRQGLSIGTLAVAIGAVIYAVQVWVYNEFIDDSLLVSVREFQLAAWQDQGLSGATLESAISQLEISLLPGVFAVLVCLRLIFLGVGFALIISLINRRPPST